MSKQFWSYLSIGVLAGFFSGLLGVGGGVITLPILTKYLKVPQKTAQGTTLFMIIPSAIIASTNYYIHGNLNITHAIWIATGSMVGVYIGSMLAHKTHSIWLEKGCGLLFILAALKMYWTN